MFSSRSSAKTGLLLAMLAGIPLQTFASDSFTVEVEVDHVHPVAQVQFVLKGSTALQEIKVKNGSKQDKDKSKLTVTIVVPFKKEDVKFVIKDALEEDHTWPPTVNPLSFEDNFSLLPDEDLFGLRFYGLQPLSGTGVLAAIFDSEAYSPSNPTLGVGDILSIEDGHALGHAGITWVDVSGAFADAGELIGALASPGSVNLADLPAYSGDTEVVWVSRFVANIPEPSVMPMLLCFGTLLFAFAAQSRGRRKPWEHKMMRQASEVNG